MSGILGFVSDLLFGKVKAPKANFDELAKLIETGVDANRYDQYGLFTNNIWDANKESMATSINPEIEPAFQNFLMGLNQGAPRYDGAGRYDELLNASMFGKQPPRREPMRRDKPNIERLKGIYPDDVEP